MSFLSVRLGVVEMCMEGRQRRKGGRERRLNISEKGEDIEGMLEYWLDAMMALLVARER